MRVFMISLLLTQDRVDNSLCDTHASLLVTLGNVQ